MDYRSGLKKFAFSNASGMCKCCGCRSAYNADGGEGMCSFCEAHVSKGDEEVIKDSPDLEATASSMQESVNKGAWMDASGAADVLAEGAYIYGIYGAANFYSFYSDHVYNDVDYKLPAFMGRNADNRNDEGNRNKHNAMYLTSKSREFYYRAIKLISDTNTLDAEILYIEFMCNIKLRRLAQAKVVLKVINDLRMNDLVSRYANMVYSVEANQKDAVGRIDELVKDNEVNALYYLAKHLAKKKDLGSAGYVLSLLMSNVKSPEYSRLLMKIESFENAAGI